ncbi:pyridoxal-phosphate-dependent aminotransferase family protein [Peptoniphilus indolicus]|uniref:Aminotransferase n=2 Tax=Peptoniphilus indolicus TaxID=33030 RepID=G4D1L6_9FIRM|nr:alanine--glyoxylate aminotransferase family protein [Peptoniphilus indolicus]EGY80578.1 aminotransferase [Peptoniphilus indolicus ATCC 29427]SUB75617.1 Soluble hydrogenase 42 kDa subunit [Peptoniphilus indolicus]SUB94784.1 Soluble hydrogenase 42 kDa subunit [Peptoniphilus indolicus]
MKILCAGPTSISPEVLNALSKSKTNPDLDPEYQVFHRSVEKKISKLLNTEATSFFMLGEGIMGLEAAIISLVEPQDRVLVLSNGFFGAGFADYVKFAGGTPVVLEFDFRNGIDVNKLDSFLQQDSNFKLATFVHCETPSGLTNDLNEIVSVLKKYNILTIADCVSSLGGEAIDFDESGLDVLLGGSQKCLSAPVGITIVTISDRAKKVIDDRKTPVISYYMNFKNYYDFKGAPFCYTMNENLIYAMDIALEELFNRNSIELHKTYADITREIIQSAGLELYAKNCRSNTVTAVLMPNEIESESLLKLMRQKYIAISKGVGNMSEKLFRIGHMGQNISKDNFKALFKALDECFKELGVELKISLYDSFCEKIGEV